ncbi:hypothetical protein [Mucilaginibacter celer]|uniref:Uncharacterized protein n=1 Tax=Mucilaginibacter celer TaxID=2305508 RepID=A0A494VQQ2_9SPHI|nr:hypothetical protein [Mucilaginibacter celer]AYL96311.1 hypothetical protein HYN43_013855 [Mucilaginibacter celer]
MTINISNTKSILVLSIVYAFLQVFVFAAIKLRLPKFEYAYLAESLVDIIYILWTSLYIIGLLKSANEKSIISGLLVVYIVCHVINSITPNLLIYGSEASYKLYAKWGSTFTTISYYVFVFTWLITFTIKRREFKAQLQFLIFAEILTTMFYAIIPFLAPYFPALNNLDKFIWYISLIDLLIPFAGMYLAVGILNLLNSQPNIEANNYQGEGHIIWPDEL